MRRHIDDDELMLSLDGELSPRRQVRVAQHLGMCVTCRRRVDRIRSTMADVAALYRTDYAASSQRPDYGPVRLAAAMREATSPGRHASNAHPEASAVSLRRR